jgi:5-(carboxyamino)imidazole ribonucleotide synthase
MQNLIGDAVKQLPSFFNNPNAKIHLYGKQEVRPGRKMGHVNILEP